MSLKSIKQWEKVIFDDIIDVRTPLEYLEDHIPSSINLPVLDNEERILIGKIYKKESPFKKTIAHGYYTLSLLPKFFNEVWECKNIGLVLNYGSDKVRFISPVLCDTQIRANISLLDAYDYKSGTMLKSKVDIEIKNSDRLAMSAETLSLLFETK